MRWLHAGNKRAKHAQAREEAVVMAVTTPLNRDTAIELRRQVDLVNPHTDVVIDLTAIPAFDSDGADALFELQAEHAERRISIVGFRQATARLMGPDAEVALPDPLVGPGGSGRSGGSGWVVRRLRNLVVVQPEEASAASADGLEGVITDVADGADAAIIVIDLRGVALLPASAVDAIAFASSTAAVRGQELLVVNVPADGVDALRSAGLSATTFVAPEPLEQAPPYGDPAPLGDQPPWRNAQLRP